MKKIIALLLLVATLSVLFAACDNGGSDAETTGTTATTTEVVTTEEQTTEEGGNTGTTVTTEETTTVEEITYRTDAVGNVLSNIPDDTDFDGETIDVYTWTEFRATSFPANGDSTDVVSQTVYLRNLDLQSSSGLNFAFDVTAQAGSGGYKDWLTVARQAGDRGFDLFCGYTSWIAVLATENQLYNMQRLQFPELTMPWWPESLSRWKIYDSLFYVTSNSSVTAIGANECVFCNQELIAEQQMTDPVELVLTYQWTLDKFYEYVTAFHSMSVNSPKESKFYALVIDDISKMHSFYYGSGLSSARTEIKSGQSVPTAAFTSASDVEKITSFVDKVLKFTTTDECLVGGEGDRRMMQSRSCVFCVCSLRDILETSDDAPYAACPPPMYDEAQHAYYSCNNWAYELWAIPIGADNPEHSGMIIEKIAESDYNEIAPLYFDRKLKMRYTRDELGEQVYEIIRKSFTLDFFRINSSNMNSKLGEQWYGECIKAGENTYANRVASENSKGQVTKQIQQLIAAFKRFSVVTE